MRLFTHLRRGDFLNAQRVQLWAGAMAAALALTVLFLAVTAHGINDYDGRPLGTDFSNVYAAGRAALAGDPAAPFDIVRQGEMERAIFGPKTQLYGWHYPPLFLLVATPLALLPYVPALLLWLMATLILYLTSVYVLLRQSAAPHLGRGAGWMAVALGFTAVFVNFIHGQNGFLTAALLGFGLGLRDRRPALAGIAFGLLCYKPQYFALIPLVLLANARWRILCWAIGTALAASLAATLIFGTGIWAAFIAGAHFTRTVVLEQGSTGFEKMQSVFAAVRLLGGSVVLAYVVQGLAALVTILALWRIWRSPTSHEVQGAALCLATLLITPYSLDYDLMILAPAIALLAADGLARGFRDWRIATLILLWVLPGFTRAIAQHMHIPLMAPVAFGLLLILWSDASSKALSCARNQGLR